MKPLHEKNILVAVWGAEWCVPLILAELRQAGAKVAVASPQPVDGADWHLSWKTGKPEQLLAAWNRKRAKIGHMHGAVNLVSLPTQPFGSWGISPERWKLAGQTIALAGALCALEMGVMLHTGGGTIVNVANPNGDLLGLEDAATKVASSGIEGLAEVLAKETARQLTNMHSLCLGYVEDAPVWATERGKAELSLHTLEGPRQLRCSLADNARAVPWLLSGHPFGVSGVRLG